MLVLCHTCDTYHVYRLLFCLVELKLMLSIPSYKLKYLVKLVPNGTYKSKSFPLRKVIVHPKETNKNIETMTESPTE